MKNKLEKHGKKKSYFVYRKCLFVLLAILLVGAVVAVPTTISLVNAHNSQIAERSK